MFLAVLGAPRTAAADGAAPSSPPPPSLLETFNVEAFADAYASVNWGFPRPGTPAPAEGTTSGNGLRAFDTANGASIHWVGLNAAYDPAPVGGTLNLRFGPSAPRYAGVDAAPGVGLEYVKQAFASFRPGGKSGHFTLDFGKFDAPVSSEVADNPYNANYTRSLLFYFAQPFFFTGVRAGYVVSERLELKALAANGWNESIDANRGKTLGAVVVTRPTDTLGVSVAYVTGPEQPDSSTSTCAAGTAFDRATAACAPAPGADAASYALDDDDANTRWRHFVDVVVDFSPSRRFRLLANGPWAGEPVRRSGLGGPTWVSWYGANVAARWRFTELFALAARGEGYWDPEGASMFTGRRTNVWSGTLSFILSPTSHLWLFLDHRADVANYALFQRSLSDTAPSQFTTTLGVVVSTSAKTGM